jgi:hypothetical protein
MKIERTYVLSVVPVHEIWVRWRVMYCSLADV